MDNRTDVSTNSVLNMDRIEVIIDGVNVGVKKDSAIDRVGVTKIDDVEERFIEKELAS